MTRPFTARVGAATAIAALALAGLAVASMSKTLNTRAVNSLNEKIAVDHRGITVYALRGETSKALLCSSTTCLSLWHPFKVKPGAKLTKASGIKGKLTTLKRGSINQLVVGGDPVYYYSLGNKKGDVSGNGIKSFGGTWHVLGAGPITGGY